MSADEQSAQGERTASWAAPDAPAPAGPPAADAAAPERQWRIPAPIVPPAPFPPGAPGWADRSSAPSPSGAPGWADGSSAPSSSGPFPEPGHPGPLAAPPAAWPQAPSGPAWSPPPPAVGGFGPPPPPGAHGIGPPPPGATPAAGSSAGVWIGFGLATFVALCALVFLVGAIVATSGDGEPTASVGEGASASETPTTGADGRLAAPPEVPAETGPHTFVRTEPDGDPAAWDPCQPIRYVVNSRRAPPGAMGIMEEAIDRIEGATGLVFVDEGATDETAPPGEGGGRADRDPRYGDDWSPVLITWTDVMEDPELDGLAGLAYSTAKTSASGERVLVTGYVEMAGEYATELIEDGQRDAVLSVMMHELGHLVGLGHVTDPTQVMTDDPNSTPSTWGAGDLQGLAAVGRGECVPDL